MDLPYLLVTSLPRRQRFAEIESMDSLLPKDRSAKLLRTPFPGVFLIETGLDPSLAASLVKSPRNPSVSRVVIIWKFLEDPAEEEIVSACKDLCAAVRPGKVKVRCRLRGRGRGDHELERKIGAELVEKLGVSVDLENPDLTICVEGVDGRVGVGFEA